MAAIAAAPAPRRLRWWWLLPPAAAAAAAALLLMGMVRVPAPPPPPVTRQWGSSPSCGGLSARLRSGGLRGRRRPRACPTGRRAEPHEPLLMKIVTDDPNVVIYWIVEDKQRGD